jgi:hypothetical protein
MRVRQHAYLLIRSDVLAPVEVTARLGLEPDQVKPRGSQAVGPPPRPQVHIWIVRSGRPETATVEAHLDRLLARLEPHVDRIGALLAEDHTSGVIEIVRYFEVGKEDDEVLAIGQGSDSLERLRGQHSLLGFHLDQRLIRFVNHTQITIDIDEYGDEHE